MKLTPPQTLAQLAQLLGCTYIGPADHLVTGINEIHRVEPGDLTFVDVPKYFKKALTSAATTVLINQAVEAPEGKGLLVTDEPFSAFNRLTEHFKPTLPLPTEGLYNVSTPNDLPADLAEAPISIGRNVVFGQDVTLEPGVEIGHNVVIGSRVHIGAGSRIYHNVTVCDDSHLGRFVTLHPGCVIGGEAFYFKKRPVGRDKMLTKGLTILGNHVEIGANTTIDRGVSAVTQVGDHTKIDNLVQIGHDTIIGANCVIAAQVGIAGVCEIEDEVVLWGQVGIASDIVIGKGAVLLAKSGVISSLEGGKTYFGFVAKEFKKHWREIAAMEQLPELLRRVEALEAPKED